MTGSLLTGRPGSLGSFRCLGASMVLALIGTTGCGPGPEEGAEPEAAELSAAFHAEDATGTMVIRRLSDGREWVHNPARADSAFVPASTFKILNAAIALEEGVASGPDHPFPWDGVERDFQVWNQDHTLATAMTASAVPVYQEIARAVGEERMTRRLAEAGYGNGSTGGGIDRFWLTGELRTSARDQVAFLTRMIIGDLPFSERTLEQVAGMLMADQGDGWVLRGKTGWAFEVELGWWVGWAEREGETFAFALNMAMPDAASDPPKRVRVGRDALVAVGAIPAPSTAGAPRAQDEIRDADQLEARAVLEGDVELQEQVWGEEFVVTNTEGEVLTRAQVLSAFRAGARPYAELERVTERVQDHGQVAVSLGRERVVPMGAPAEHPGVERRYTHVWVNRGDTWKLVARQAIRLPER